MPIIYTFVRPNTNYYIEKPNRFVINHNGRYLIALAKKNVSISLLVSQNAFENVTAA